jgi:hypothetical protein
MLVGVVVVALQDGAIRPLQAKRSPDLLGRPAGIQKHAHLALREEHQRLVIVRTMPPTRSILMSIPAVCAGTDAGGCAMDVTQDAFAMPPRSTNVAGCAS